tara:strand:+ start:2189 stop:3580 length:1392 start_codon:yes stop_codon:yes gene_type:complete
MATYGQYYYDGLDFLSSTGIYTDAALSIHAADGWYSQNGIFREVSGGVLMAPVNCPTCQVPCGSPVSGSGNTGVYRISFDFGTDTGASIVTFNPGTDANSQNPVPDKMTWTFDGTTASEYSSYLGGYMTGYIGSPDACVCCQDCDVTVLGSGGLTVSNGTNGNSFTGVSIYTYTNGAFVNSGATTTIPAWGGNATQTGVNDGGGDQTLTVCSSTVPTVGYASYNATMVVPVPVGAGSSVVDFEITAPCVSTFFTFEVQCPSLLNGFRCSNVEALEADACGKAKVNTYYNAAVNTKGNPLRPAGQGGPIAATPATQVGLHDWAYTDAYGVTALATGWYSITNLISTNLVENLIFVSTNGVITQIKGCPACSNDIYISTMRAACTDFCDGTNYLINSQKQTISCETYGSVTIGSIIAGASIAAGWYAYAATSTDTTVGTYRIMEIDSNNEVISLRQCSGPLCVVL